MYYCRKRSQSSVRGGPGREASAPSERGKEVFLEESLRWVWKEFIRMTRDGEAYFRCVQK